MDLEYANNATMFSNTITELKAGLNVFQEQASKLGLQVGWEKIKLKHVYVDFSFCCVNIDPNDFSL